MASDWSTTSRWQSLSQGLGQMRPQTLGRGLVLRMISIASMYRSSFTAAT